MYTLFTITLAVSVLGFMMVGGSGGESPNDDNSTIPVDKNTNYEYDSEADMNDTYSGIPATFDVNVNDGVYQVQRTDAVPNPGSTLAVEDAQIVGNTLVIEESFVDETDDNIASASVISTGSYSESWNLEVDIQKVAVEHPYNDHPYVESIE